MGPVWVHLKQDPGAAAWCQAACAAVGAQTSGPAFDKAPHSDEGQACHETEWRKPKERPRSVGVFKD